MSWFPSLPGGFTQAPVEAIGNTPIHQHNPGSRVSKFTGLQGFAKLDNSDGFNLHIAHGRDFPYAEVGTLYYITHPQDQEINDRVVVIFRTNNDSWSCYGFCKHPNRVEWSNQEFKNEHIAAVEQIPAQSDSVDNAPTVVLQLQDVSGRSLRVDSHLWINCRQMLDIKHTVQMAWIGLLRKDSLHELLKKGKAVFDSTYGDVDKKRYGIPSSQKKKKEAH